MTPPLARKCRENGLGTHKRGPAELKREDTLVLAFVLAWLAAAEKPHAWESAIVVSQEIQSRAMASHEPTDVETSRYQFKSAGTRRYTDHRPGKRADSVHDRTANLFVVLDGTPTSTNSPWSEWRKK